VSEVDAIPERVVVYVTRGDTLLVFAHRGDPRPGIQVPAGHLDAGEAPADGAVREVMEETGVSCRVVRVLDTIDQHQLDGALRRNHFVHATTDEPRELWTHVGTGGGLDDGMAFDCGFLELEHAPHVLGARQSACLDQLGRDQAVAATSVRRSL
jgi:8-oxo-dGTP pyrophosphatase MutT (NUDIX family)